MMYEYIFVRVQTQAMFSREIPYKEMIQDYARMGYRFVSAIPARENMEGVTYAYDLVFEKPVDEKDL
jgi:hypothetical protein